MQVDLAGLLKRFPAWWKRARIPPEYLAAYQDFVLKLVRAAIAKLNEMRRREGAALWADLHRHLDIIRFSLAKIAQFAPAVVRTYHERLRARVNQMVSDAKLSLSDHDLLKEVALFADRADISEEIARLGGHPSDQFIAVCQKDDANGTGKGEGGGGGASGGAVGGDGRKLDFIAQEMLREANTIASKANDSAIARLTVDIKSAIDRIKEQVQNAE